MLKDNRLILKRQLNNKFIMKKRVLTACLSLCACAPLCAQTAAGSVKTVKNVTFTTNATPEQLRQNADTLRRSAAAMRQSAAEMRQSAKAMKKQAKAADKVSKNNIKAGARNMEAGARNMELGAASMEMAAKSMEQNAKTPAKGGDKTICDNPDKFPSFPGGPSSLFRYLQKEVRYPADAAKDHIAGKVVVRFVVDTDGTISDAEVVRGVHPELDREALRAVRAMPRWTPGQKNGKPVRVRFSTPITFKVP